MKKNEKKKRKKEKEKPTWDRDGGEQDVDCLNKKEHICFAILAQSRIERRLRNRHLRKQASVC